MKSLCHATLFVSALFAAGGDAAAAPPERHLKAARPKANLAMRSNGIALRQKFELHYVDDHVWNPAAMGAQLELENSAHTLVLEEIEHLLEEVHCTSDADLKIRFRPEHFSEARDLLRATPDLFLITSHAGCNKQGTRMPYKAIDRNFVEKERTVSFTLGEACWKKDFGMKMRFGPADRETYHILPHDHLATRNRKRDSRSNSVLPPPTAGSSAPASQSSQSSTTPLQFPTPTQTADPSVTSVTDSVAFSIKDTQIFPPILGNTSIVGQALGVGYKINCTDCSTTGQVSLASGYFSTAGKNSSNSTESSLESAFDSLDFLGDGFVEVATNGLGAHMAFKVTWLTGTGQSVQLSLGQIPLTPFAIPGVANVGGTFIPNVIFSADVGSDTSFEYGFSVSVPDNSTAVASFSESQNSTVAGFGQSQIKGLPFQTDLKSPNLTLSATLKPEILLGIDILNQKTGAGVFLNLPKVSVRVSQVSGTNERCEGALTQGDAKHVGDVGKLLGNLTHIEPSVDLAAGFQVEAASVGTRAFTPFTTSFPLPTDCLVFHSAAKSYGPATAAFASATAAQTSSSAAAPRMLTTGGDDTPLDILARWQWMIVLLSMVGGGFVVL